MSLVNSRAVVSMHRSIVRVVMKAVIAAMGSQCLKILIGSKGLQVKRRTRAK